MADVHVAVEGAELGAEHAQERQLERLDDGDVEALLARRRRDLAADPARPDDDQVAAAALEHGADRVGVAERAQHVDAVEVGARQRQALGLGARGQQQAVVGDLLAALEHDRAGREVDALGAHAGAQRHVVVGVPALLLQVGPRSARSRRAGNPCSAAGARRAIGLGADEDDVAVEALLAQRLDRLSAGHPGAHDHECGAHVRSPSVS